MLCEDQVARMYKIENSNKKCSKSSREYLGVEIHVKKKENEPWKADSGSQMSQQCRSHFQIVRTRMVTRNKLQTQDPPI